MKTLLTLLILSVVTASASAVEPEWNQFRGGRGDGSSQANGIPTTWSETKNVAWKTSIWGKAWSSPVVWKNRIWATTATADGRRLAVMCLDKTTGKILHDQTVFRPVKPQYGDPFNSYASSTAWVEDGRVYIHFGSLGTACLDTETYKVLWKRNDLPCNHFRGAASSVSIHGNQMFLPFDGSDVQYVVALDKRTGKTLWRTDRNVDFGGLGGAHRKAFCTARVITHNGRAQVIIPAALATMSYDPATGEELWRVMHGGANTACPALFHKGVLFFNSGDVTNRLMAVRPDGRGDVTKTHVKWATMRGVPSRPSVVRSGDAIYMVNNDGIASCVDTATGRTRWARRLTGKYCASPILVGERVFCFEEEKGLCHVFAADPKRYRKLATNTLDASFMASPAVTDGMLILRTKSHVYGIASNLHRP
ncbi:MAG TPA: quinonprotein alcohol dehydrogenase [Planctomycetaceae bacterium]|nr:quinonprotein alcohol dehydrogenase [Planctomycetaceae bacterium]